MELMPNHAPATALAFLVTGLIAGGGGVLFLGLTLSGRPRSALRVLSGMVSVGVLYAVGLVSAAFVSADRVLGPGESKYFCELDCHVAVSLVGLETEDALGAGVSRVEASGRFHVVTVRVWFDEATTSVRRPLDATYRLSRKRVRVVDGDGGMWTPSVAGHEALGASIDGLDGPLLPGAEYEARYVFDLPDDVREPRLLVEDRSLMSTFLIGHENSPFHGKVLFELGSPAVSSR